VIATPNSMLTFKMILKYGIKLFFKSTTPSATKDAVKTLIMEDKVIFFVCPWKRGEIQILDETCYRCEQGK
jgi:hypothetical protein